MSLVNPVQYLLNMKPAQAKKIKASFIKVLQQKNVYEKEIDDFLIDQFILNLKLIADSEKDIAKRGNLINLRQANQEPYFQINFSISILHNAIKSNNTILKQLGLEKAKIEIDTKETAFNNLQSLLN